MFDFKRRIKDSRKLDGRQKWCMKGNIIYFIVSFLLFVISIWFISHEVANKIIRNFVSLQYHTFNVLQIMNRRKSKRQPKILDISKFLYQISSCIFWCYTFSPNTACKFKVEIKIYILVIWFLVLIIVQSWKISDIKWK